LEKHPKPIGVFDSGVGGLSVLRAIWEELPEESVIYFADQAHVPYGSRSLQEVRSFSEEITQYLLDRGSKLIVVACNTASAAALHNLRATFPRIPFVGMEPAVKPAAEHTHSKKVGVLATPATFQGALYASVVERFANGVELHQHTCPGLVQQIERGNLYTPETQKILKNALHPMLKLGIDTIVLGCTHYPFVIPTIEQISGTEVRVIDPAPAVARQVRRQLELHKLQKPVSIQTNIKQPFLTDYLTSGDTEKFKTAIENLLNIQTNVQAVRWQGLKLSP
jgi:glutamate racemase